MTQIIVEVIKSVIIDEIAHLEIQLGNRRLTIQVTADKVDTPEKLADWLIRQPLPPQSINEAIHKRLVIDFHTENFLDEDGQTRPLRVLDGVVVEALPEEKALGDIAAIPNWATWSVAQAHTWINTNITDLPAPVMALFRGLAQMAILERDAIIGLKRRGE